MHCLNILKNRPEKTATPSYLYLNQSGFLESYFLYSLLDQEKVIWKFYSWIKDKWMFLLGGKKNKNKKQETGTACTEA